MQRTVRHRAPSQRRVRCRRCPGRHPHAFQDCAGVRPDERSPPSSSRLACARPARDLRGHFSIVSHPLDDADAIVSLASHEWERLPLTARLARQHPAALVILTLPRTVSRYNCHDCYARVARLVAAGIAPERIHILPLTEEGTYGEATACRQFLSATPRKELLRCHVAVPHAPRAGSLSGRFPGNGYADWRGAGVGVLARSTWLVVVIELRPPVCQLRVGGNRVLRWKVSDPSSWPRMMSAAVCSSCNITVFHAASPVLNKVPQSATGTLGMAVPYMGLGCHSG